MTTQTPEHSPTRTPEFHMVAIVALAKSDPKAAACYIERIEAAARFRGGARTAAALGHP